MKDERLRNQLLNLGERFIGFDKLIESESIKARKNLDSERSEILYDRISEIEKLKYLEIKSRTEMNR